MEFENFFLQRGITLKNPKQMQTAFTHTSYANEHRVESYERLEFLGDAVLEVITSEYFYLNTDLKEGDMTKIRASYVCEHALATYAKEIGLNKYIRVGHGQLENINDTIIADVFESVLGAIYLDAGYDAAKTYAYQIIVPYIEKKAVFLTDYKSALQEMVQTDKESLTYELVKEEGPAHDKTFTVNVVIDDIIYGTGVGKSKKEAEQKAAYDAYQKRAK